MSHDGVELFFKKRIFYLFIYRERAREGEREKHWCVRLIASRTPSSGDLACNPGMCPDQDSNRQLFGLPASAQPTELFAIILPSSIVLHFRSVHSCQCRLSAVRVCLCAQALDSKILELPYTCPRRCLFHSRIWCEWKCLDATLHHFFIVVKYT